MRGTCYRVPSNRPSSACLGDKPPPCLALLFGRCALPELVAWHVRYEACALTGAGWRGCNASSGQRIKRGRRHLRSERKRRNCNCRHHRQTNKNLIFHFSGHQENAILRKSTSGSIEQMFPSNAMSFSVQDNSRQAVRKVMLFINATSYLY
jgi:hypothetical protein